VEIFNASEAARMLKVSEPYIYKLASSGRISHLKIPCPGNGKIKKRYLIRFKKQDLIDFTEAHYFPAT